MRTALITFAPVRCATAAQNDGPSSPCSCTWVNPIASASAAISSSGWLTKTPTVSSRRCITRAIPAAIAGSAMRGERGQRMKPIPQAPSVAASSASSGRVIPQTFTRERSDDRGAAEGMSRLSSGQLAEAREPAHGGLDVQRAHERLADQHRVDADALELVELVARGEAGLRDHGLARRHVGEQVVGALDVDAEVGEIAVVDPEHVGLDLQRGLELALVVDLDERVEVQRARLLQQLPEVGQLERGDD